MTAPPPQPRDLDRRAPLRRLARVALVVSTVALVGLILAQAVLAGAALEGDAGALRAHGDHAELIGFLTLGQVLVAAVLAALRGPWWPLPVAVVAFVLTGNQIGWGTDRVLEAHVPVGVGLLGAHAVMATALWCRSPRDLLPPE